ncbi:MAG: redox-regulated ATPase YchF [Symbiobacteriaceae bacterium]|nr:redox-regulated ATPase YchF [Symbiobacteriaceae bacterium]
MKVGLIGLPLSGKTTLFNLLCGSNAATSSFFSGRSEANFGIAKVPDPRLDWLGELYHPRRTVYAQIEVTDLPGLYHGERSSGNSFLQAVRQVDALVHVARAFAGNVEHVDGSVNFMRDVDKVQVELLIADLDLIERRLQRIISGKKVTPEQKAEMGLLEACREALEKEQPLATIGLTPAEELTLSHYGFFTQLPQLLVLNLDEKQLRQGNCPGQEEVEQWAQERGFTVLTVSAALEEEIARLPASERTPFLQDLGVTSPGAARLAQGMYALLNLISFFTVGEDEVKAWTIRAGLDAKRAAGKIHSDLERGFIRAETAAYNDLYAHGSMAKLREKGLLRLEGKDYIVKDGDIMNIRFNV